MSLVTLSSEDCEMIEKCIDMISMQCRMVGNLLRRARDASGAVHHRGHHDFSPADSNEGMIDMLSNAASTLASTAHHVSGDFGRKRQRMRYDAAGGDALHEDSDAGHGHGLTPQTAKRRGRPPRDYGEELGPAFAMYASEHYPRTEQSIAERSGGRAAKPDVLRAVWDAWWVSSQSTKDKYLALSRHEMAANDTHMLELLLDYPLPPEAAGRHAAHGHGHGHAGSPEAPSAFDVYMREQIPQLRSKVPEWSEAELHRRLSVNWSNMTSAERDRYAVAAAASAAAAAAAAHQHHHHSGSGYAPLGASTPANGGGGGGGGSGGRAGHAKPPGQRGAGQSAPRRAYVVFCRQERPLLVQANPTWDLPTVNKELGRRWKELTPEQKEVYHDLERSESDARPATSMAARPADPYASDAAPATLTPTASRALPAPGSARSTAGRSGALGSGNPNKGPSKAYVFYSRLNRKTVTSEHPEWDLATINKELGRMWKSLSLDERQSWEDRAAAAAASAAQPAAAAAAAAAPSPFRASPSAALHHPDAPATPASGASTPSTTTKDDPRRPDLDVDADADADAEGIAEDVEMQDDDDDDEDDDVTDDDDRAGPHRHAARAGPPSDATAYASPAALHTPAAAPIRLPKHHLPAAHIAGPPPTAKPAVANGSALAHHLAASSALVSSPSAAHAQLPDAH
ncbi:hypothetical protein H4R18_001564 [Coemansia javaensis]|uniref:HMG box domain-containing protein n=1 Tax=Coemansia javaensis TaxID=2761396 RepID=A0A9W8HK65_9FUNG|nr:hypothetical protein H4R18_001564 [Coemansia javaensis]